jgi:hypothetical protein
MRRSRSWKSSRANASSRSLSGEEPTEDWPIPTNYTAEAGCFPGESEKIGHGEPKSRVASAPQLRTKGSIRI